MRINWGIIGCGRLTCLRIVPAFAKSRDNRLLAVADNAVNKVAAQAGKHILCEKPMALTVKDCEKMIEVCRQ